MRAFIAVELSEGLKQRIGELVARLRELPQAEQVRWSDPASTHLTLRFLGAISEIQAEQVGGLLDRSLAGRPRFEFDLGRSIGCFPNWGRPRVFWVGLEQTSDQLIELQAELERGLVELGFTTEQRSFHPHLTLGRAKRQADRKQVVALGQTLQELELEGLGSIAVDEVSLMKSDLRPTGAVHTRIHAARLG